MEVIELYLSIYRLDSDEAIYEGIKLISKKEECIYSLFRIYSRARTSCYDNDVIQLLPTHETDFDHEMRTVHDASLTLLRSEGE